MPEGTPRRAVIVVQEAFGVNDHIIDLCERLARDGYMAVAPHMFHRTGDPVFAYDDFSSIFSHIEAMTMDGVMEDIDAAIGAISDSGVATSKIGIVGFCMGGSISMHVAATRDIGAGVGFYGGGIKGRWFFPSQIDAVQHLRAPWLGIFGDKDQSIPVQDVEELREASKLSPNQVEIIRYKDADHGFNCDARASFHAESASDAWQRMLDWYDTYLN
jgi:carboxymethylenebutenolidase